MSPDGAQMRMTGSNNMRPGQIDLNSVKNANAPAAMGSPSPSQVVNLLYMEDFDPDVDPEFIKKELRPYFSQVFADLALRST